MNNTHLKHMCNLFCALVLKHSTLLYEGLCRWLAHTWTLCTQVSITYIQAQTRSTVCWTRLSKKMAKQMMSRKISVCMSRNSTQSVLHISRISRFSTWSIVMLATGFGHFSHICFEFISSCFPQDPQILCPKCTLNTCNLGGWYVQHAASPKWYISYNVDNLRPLPRQHAMHILRLCCGILLWPLRHLECLWSSSPRTSTTSSPSLATSSLMADLYYFHAQLLVCVIIVFIRHADQAMPAWIFSSMLSMRCFMTGWPLVFFFRMRFACDFRFANAAFLRLSRSSCSTRHYCPNPGAQHHQQTWLRERKIICIPWLTGR